MSCTAHHICPLNYPSSKILYTAKCFLKMKIQKTDKMYKEVNWLKQVVNLVSNSIQFFCYVWTLTKEKVHLLANTTFPISWSTGPKVVLLKWIEWYDEDQLWWDDATFLSKSQFLFFFLKILKTTICQQAKDWCFAFLGTLIMFSNIVALSTSSSAFPSVLIL